MLRWRSADPLPETETDTHCAKHPSQPADGEEQPDDGGHQHDGEPDLTGLPGDLIGGYPAEHASGHGPTLTRPDGPGPAAPQRDTLCCACRVTDAARDAG